MKNLSESILYNIHKSEEINKKQLKLFEESGVIDDFLSRKLDTICNEVRISRQTIPMDVDWKPAEENSFYIMPEINDYTSEDVDDWEETLESLEDTIMDVATKYFPEAEVYKEGNWYLLKLDEDDFLDESVSRNLNTKSRRKAKKLNESSILDVDGSSDLNDIMESDEVMYIINAYGNADIDVGQIIHDYTSNLMRLDIDAVKKALSDWASDIRERMGDM